MPEPSQSVSIRQRSSPDNLATQSAVMLVAMVFMTLLSTAIMIAVARLSGPESYGVYTLVLSLQAVVVLAATFGIPQAMVKFVSEFSEMSENESSIMVGMATSLLLIVTSLVCAVYVLFAPIIAIGVYHDERVASLIPLSAAVVFTGSLLGHLLAIIQGRRDTVFLAIVRLTALGLGFVLILLMTPLLSLGGVLLATALAQAAAIILLFMRLKRSGVALRFSLSGLGSSPYLKSVLNYAIPALLASSIVAPAFFLCNTKLEVEQGFSAIGFLGIALAFQSIVIMIPSAISVPLIPTLSQLSFSRSRLLDETMQSVYSATSFLLFVSCLGIGLFSREIIIYVFGKGYAGSTEIAFLIVAGSYALGMNSIIACLILGIGKMWTNLVLNLLWAGSFVALIFALVPAGGLAGYGLAFFISYIFSHLLSVIVARKYFGVDLIGKFRTTTVGLFVLAFSYYSLRGVSNHNHFLISSVLFVIGVCVLILADRGALGDAVRQVRSIA